MPFGAGGLEAGQAFVDLVPRLSPNFAQQTSSALSAGLRPAGATIGNELEAAGAAAGTRTGTAAATGIGGSLRTGLGGVATSMAGLFAGIGAVRIIGDAVSEAREAIKVGEQTKAVIKSTGGEAGVTAGHVGELANKLSLVAGVDDELVQQGENVLLTFTNIRNRVGEGNDVFDRATTLALDMSKALGTDLQGSIIQVGKALNDPIKGVTALQRVGVSFTESQKDQIKVLVESGKTLEAQKIILGELGKEFGGAAEATADPLDKASVAAKNLEETVGLALLPVLTDLANIFAKDIAPIITEVVKLFETLPGPVRTGIVAIIGIGIAASAFGSIIGSLGLLFNPWILAIVAVIAIGVLLVKHWDDIKKALSAAWEFIRDTAVQTWTAIRDFFVNLWADIERLFNEAVNAVRDFVVNAFNDVVAFFVSIPGRILAALAALPGLLFGLWRDAMNAQLNAVIAGAEAIFGYVAGIPGRILSELGDLGGLLYNAGKAIISGLFNGIKDAVGGVFSFVGGIGGKIASLKGPIEYDRELLRPAGGAIIGGLLTGIDEALPGLYAKVAGISPNITANVTATARTVTPVAATTTGGGLTINGPLLELSGPVSIRSDNDISALSRAIQRDLARAQRAAGKAEALLP